ncbi:MAG: hypothetical protein IT350_03595 [Deltaproteobacteria bacterium]|nr:hypothetical protein [Deltaproteobacteria bacterium]
MAKKPGSKGFDSIFDATETKSAKTARARKTAAKTSTPAGAPAAPSTEAKPENGNGNGFEPYDIDRFSVVKTLLKTHEDEVIYRKSKEDRLLITGISLVAGVAIGAFLIRALCGATCTGSWIYSLLFRLFFAGMVGLTGFTIAAMMELNRTRLQDLLAIVVKIHEQFRLFDDGVYDNSGSAFLPNTYKFVGSINDDETNYALLVLKVASVVTAVFVLFFV